MEQFSRNIRLWGEEAQRRIEAARVAVVGLGGVGGHLFEALCRAGVGRILAVDGDVVEQSNLNRQLLATWDQLGKPKVEAARARAQTVNPACRVEALRLFVTEANASQLEFTGYDYVCDAIDSVSGKIAIIARARACGAPVISCMGAGNKLDPTAFRVADIEQTSVCPLARIMRRELKARGLTVKAVYSTEAPRPPLGGSRELGSCSFVPAAAGLVMAGAVLRAIAGLELTP